MSIYPTGFCWKCGLPIKEGLLYCPAPKKCNKQAELKQRREQNKINSKRDGYGIVGSTH